MRLPFLSIGLVAALAATTHGQSFDDDDMPPPPPVAVADDDGPRFTLGAARARAGVAGPTASFGATDAVQIDAIVGIASFSGAMSGPTSALGIEAGVRWMLAARGPASLSAGVRGGVAHTGGTASSTRYLVEAPVRLELAVTAWLRLHVEGGFAASYQPGSSGGGDGDGTGSGGFATESQTTWRVGSNGAAAGAGFSVAF